MLAVLLVLTITITKQQLTHAIVLVFKNIAWMLECTAHSLHAKSKLVELEDTR